jgi:hypothetical protein
MCDNPNHDHENDEFTNPIELVRNTDDGAEVLATLVASVLFVLSDHAGKKLSTPPMAMLAELCVEISKKIGNPDGVELAKFVQIAIDDNIAEMWEKVEEDDDTITWNFIGRPDEFGQGA